MSLIPEFFPKVTGFEWDDGNSDKNWLRHRVTRAEAEQFFLNRPLLVAHSPGRTQIETRYFALGRTDLDRHLAIVFAVRGALLRVISARPMSRRERRSYGQSQTTQADPKI
ncbi:MAG: BrnT family toxin [Acidobacteria bacterium]|nr:BrnT family toxin [Acidobacteriota bacterium]MBI3656147.1 BrnT family toxin [Acidobacteriota bacterium]